MSPKYLKGRTGELVAEIHGNLGPSLVVHNEVGSPIQISLRLKSIVDVADQIDPRLIEHAGITQIQIIPITARKAQIILMGEESHERTDFLGFLIETMNKLRPDLAITETENNVIIDVTDPVI